MSIKRKDKPSFKQRVISFNDKVAKKWTLPFILTRFNIGLGTSQSRWGMQSFLLTMTILGVSIFLALVFTTHSIGGTIVMWVFFTMALLSAFISVNLILFFLFNPSEDLTMEKLQNIEDAIRVLTTEIRIDREHRNSQQQTTKND